MEIIVWKVDLNQTSAEAKETPQPSVFFPGTFSSPPPFFFFFFCLSKFSEIWTPSDENSSIRACLVSPSASDLRLDIHRNNVTDKANKTLGFIRRNLRGCKTSARPAAYQGIVRPTLEYAYAAWDHWNSKHIQQLEKVQMRAARFATRNYHDRHPGSITQMIEDLH